MAEDEVVPEALRPTPEQLDFDLDLALGSIVTIRSEVPADAFTAGVLGTERTGSGVVIARKGLILTIGYLITEAETIWLTTRDGRALPGAVMGSDQATGFGLVQALGRLDLPAFSFGSVRNLRRGSRVVVAGQGGRPTALLATVAGKQEFAGYWEYLIDEALFTRPAHPSWGGAACIDLSGHLVGIGSLLIQTEPAEGDDEANGNMIVPIDLLPPVMDDLMRYGRPNRPPRPWLGMYTADTAKRPVVVGLASDGPADSAGVEVGDMVVEVAGEDIEELADLLRRVWSLGDAGVEIPLTVIRDGEPLGLRVRSADRDRFLKQPPLH